MMRNIWLHTAALAATAIGLGAGAVSAQDEAVRLGAVMSITGDLQAYGQSSLNGMNLALDQINDQGGVLDGRTIELVTGDDQTSAQAGVDTAQRLINVDGVAGLIGALSSGVTIPIAQSVTSRAEVPQISNASTSPVLTNLNDNDFLFRTIPSDALQGAVLGSVANDRGFEELAVIYINNDYGEGLAEQFREGFEGAGGTVTEMVAYEPGGASYRGELSRLNEAGGDALVLIGYPEFGATILRQSLEEGFFDSFLFTDGMKSPDVIEALGAQYLNGSIGTAPEADTESESAQLFRDAYSEEHGEVPPLPFIDSAYDAAFILALAIEKAGSTEGPAIRDAIREVANPPGKAIRPGEWQAAKEAIAAGEDINYEGAAGAQDFDNAGDTAGTIGVWEISDGEISTVDIIQPQL